MLSRFFKPILGPLSTAEFFGALALAVVIALLVFSCCGCSEALRFAPTQPQKQLAFDTHMKARAANLYGADPHSEVTRGLVAGTETALKYIGVPVDPEIQDYDATMKQAHLDAARRPDANDVLGSVDKGLSLAAELAVLFGVGGTGFGGKKLLDWIRVAREKNKALTQVVRGNELFQIQLKSQGDSTALRLFRDTQHQIQKGKTPTLVALERVPIKQQITVNPAPAQG